jgi:hypothetical protein
MWFFSKVDLGALILGHNLESKNKLQQKKV